MIDAATFAYLKYVADWGKSHLDIYDFNQRLANFTEMHNWIEEHNASGANWVAGHNQFSDWHRSEYKQMLGLKRDETVERTYNYYTETNGDDYIDWRALGAVTAVKDQGMCGSCWAFSSTGAMEGAHFLASGELEIFSEQQLVGCVTGCYGCGGGWQYKSFDYYETSKVMRESALPYSRKTYFGLTGSCEYDESAATEVVAVSNGFVTASSVSQMKAAIQTQPLSVSIEADQAVFQSYQSGVLDSTACGTSLDHAVLAVGYGNDETTGLDYWLIKNSWASTWGDQGYIKLAVVDGDGICGVQLEPETVISN